MKKFLLILTLFCAMFSAVQATEVEIGVDDESVTTSSQLPINALWKYGWSQQIYTADEIGMGGTINSITLQMYHTGSNPPAYNVNVYMIEVDDEAFADASSWVPVGEDDLVFSGITFGNLPTTAAGISAFTIELDEPFVYSGSSNLLIAFANNTGTYVSGMNSQVFGTSTDNANMTLYKYQDSPGAIDPTNPNVTGTLTHLRNVITLDITAGGSGVIPCDKPSGIEASNVTDVQATLTWAAGSGVYNVEYKKTADTVWTSLLENTTLFTATLSDLDPNTAYQARVQSVCAGNTDNPVSGWRTVNFKTECGYITSFPWSENFEGMTANTLPECWDNSASTSTSSYYPYYIWGVFSYSSNKSLRFNNYSASSGIGCTKSPYIVLPATGVYELSFDYSYTADCDELKVLVSSDGLAWDTLQSLGSTGTSTSYSAPSDWTESIVNLANYAGQTIQVQFYVSGNNMYGAIWIDNLAIYDASCVKPTDLAASEITTNSVALAWEAEEGQTAWQVEYKKSAESAWNAIEVTENPYTLENLEVYTAYDIRVATKCGESLSKYSNEVSIKTAAAAPFAEAFTSLPADWKRYAVLYSDIASGEDTLTNHPVTSGWTVSTGNGVYGVNHLKLQVYGENVKNWIVSPFIEMNQAEMQLTFDLALTKNTGTLEPAEAGAQDDDKFSVLVTTDGGETWEELYVRDNVTSADSYDNINCSADGQTVKIDLSAYTESTIAVAFYGESTVAGGNNYLHIRNFDIDTIPSCEKPMGLQVQERGDTYAKLVWDEAEDASWEYAVVVDTAATFVPADADFTGSATGYTVTISDLVAETDYAFYLRRNCGGAHSEYIERHFTTMPAPKQVPWHEDFESFTNNTIATYWDNSGSSSTTAAGSTAYYVWGVYAYGGNKMLRMNNFSVQRGTALINSPAITLPAEPAYELTFDYAHTATCGNFSVKVSLNNGATWIDLPQTFGNTSTGNDRENPGEFISATINLEEYANSTIMLQFFATSDYGSGAIFVDNVDIHEVPDCMKPMSLDTVANGITTNSVQLDWMPQGSETNWLIQYKKASAEDWTVFDGDINAHPFTLTGLEASSAYNVRVAAWCDPTDSLSASDYSNAITVTTACDVMTVFPYSENFNNLTSGTDISLPCWSNVHINGEGSKLFQVAAGSSANTTTNVGQLPDMTSGTITELTLPEMAIPAANAYEFFISVYRNASGSSYPQEGLRILVAQGTDTTELGFIARNITTTSTINQQVVVPAESTTGWYRYNFSIPVAGNVNIIIRGESKYGSSTYFDDLLIREIPDCFEPAAVKVLTKTATSVQFTYTALAQGDSLSYAVVLKGAEPTEFTGITADTVLVEGLEASTEYMLYLRTECANSSSASISTTFLTKQLPIDLGDGFADDFEGANQWNFENGELENAWVLGTAAHNGEGSTKAIYISNNGGTSNEYTISKSAVVFATKAFNIAAGSYAFQYDWKANGESSSDYLRAALVPASIDLTAGTTLPSGVSSTTLPTGCIAIDGGSKQNLSTAWATYTSPELTIPAGTYNVVFMWRNDGSIGTQSPAAIDNFSITKILCGKPGTPTIEKTNITATSAEIAWEAEEGQTAWQIALDTIAAFNPDTAQLISVNAKPYLAENLLPEHTYYVYVRANCGENGFSAWSARASFKTAKSCQKPDGLDVTAITDSSAVVTWNTYGQSAFILTYGIGNAYADTVEVVGGTYTITGLDENTSYKVKVAAACDDTQWTSAKTFKTACLPMAAVVENFDGITGSTSSHVLPDCWDYINGGSSYAAYPLVYSSESYANSGTNSLRFYTYGSSSYADQYAVLPAVNNLNTLRIKLNACKYSASYSATIVVGIMTDPADTATFVAIDTIRPAGIAYEPFIVSFGEYAGEGKYVALKAPIPASSYNAVHIDDIVMEAIPSCLEPTGLAASNIATTSATVDWTSTASQWQILLNNDSANLIDVAAKPFVLNELTPATTYTFAVRAICAEGDTSAWSKSMTFATECELISLAAADYVEGFEAYQGSTYSDANGEVPVCWEAGTDGSVAPHVIGSGSYYWTHEGTKALTFYGSGNCFAIMPKFAEPLNTAQISFWAAMESATNGTLYLGYITEEDPNTFNPITTYDRTVAKEMAFYETSLDTLPASASQLVFLWSYNSQWSCCIDDITVSLIPACPKSTGLVTTIVGDVTASFAWDAEEDVTWEYGFVVDTVANFVPADEDFTGVATTNEATLNALEPETSYLFFMRKVCGNDKSPIIYKSFRTVMTATALPYDDDFENGNSWKLINGTCTNAWTVGTLATESGNSLYISNDGGTTYAYTVTDATMVYAVKAFNFDKAGRYTVSYDWRANGESTYDYLRVAIVPATVELAAATSVPTGFGPTGLPTGWKAADGGAQLSRSNAWTSKSVIVEDIVPGYYLFVFAWRNDNGTGDQSPAAVDNIHIQHLDYPTAIGNIEGEGAEAVKFLYNDQVYILINGVVYNITGQKVEVK